MIKRLFALALLCAVVGAPSCGIGTSPSLQHDHTRQGGRGSGQHPGGQHLGQRG